MSHRHAPIPATLLLIGLLGGAGFAHGQQVRLTVLLPKADATLTIEEKPTKQTGERRVFLSPPLTPGKKYTYTLTATWKPNGYTTLMRTKTVPVQAGDGAVEIDLRQPDPAKPDKVEIIYAPTPVKVVEAMCKLAKVGKDDVVYDLGCGDGRIVIAAVKDFDAKRGIGVDIDPELVEESRANAKEAKVDDRVQFREGDVLEIKDLSDASVVMLYMGEDLNLRLRPILQKTLKPGTRVVSHRFLMGDWKPKETITVTDEDGVKCKVHLWIIGKEERGK